MTQKEIYDFVDKTNWVLNPNNCKLNEGVEFSELVPVWNDKFAFCIHALRIANNHTKKIYVITQIRPEFRADITLDDIDGDWTADDVKMVTPSQLRSNKELHEDFLKRKLE